MKSYTVHEPPRGDAAASDRIDRASHLVFVPDGFSWATAAFAPFVMIATRNWLALALYATAIVVVVAMTSALGASPEWVALAISAVHVLFGFEGGEIQRAALVSRGWSEAGTVTGRSLAECERRFIDDWLPAQPILNSVTAAPKSAAAAAPQPDRSQPAPAAPAPASGHKQWFGLPWRR